MRRPRAERPDPEDPIQAAMDGFWTSQALFAVIELDIPPIIADGPVPLAELASRTDVDEDRLRRVLRALAALGVVSRTDEGIGLTDAGRELLDADRREQIRDAIADRYVRADDLLVCLREGTTAFHRRFGEEMFDYLSDHEEERRLFTSAMTGMARHSVPAIVDALDLDGDELVVDVGGGEGSLAIALVKAHDDLQAIVFDRPQVVADAKRRIQVGGLMERCRVHEGSFFEGVPGGADLYVLGRVLHDWDDDQVVEILGNVADAADAGSRVVAVEEVVDEGDEWSAAKMKDLMMMTMTGGKERTADEYRELFERAGLEWIGVTDTGSEVELVEGRA